MPGRERSDRYPPFLIRLEKLSPKMLLTARRISVTFHSKSLSFIQNHDFSYCSDNFLILLTYLGAG